MLQENNQSARDDKAQLMQCRQERVVAAQQKANRMPANSAQQTELQATAERLRANTVAQEHYGLFEHLHSPGQPAPAGWQDVGNSQASLNQAKLSPSRLTSKQSDFRAGMYTPNRGVLGGDFSPTLTATGSPSSSEGWLNSAQQANRFQPDAYDRSVQIAAKVQVASPSQVTGGVGVTPLTSGLSATATEGDDANVTAGHSVLGVDLSDLAGLGTTINQSCSTTDMNDSHVGLEGEESAQEGIPITDAERALAEEGKYVEFWRSRHQAGDPVARTALIGWKDPEFEDASSVDRFLAAYTWWRLESYISDNGLGVSMEQLAKELVNAHVAFVDKDKKGIPNLLSPKQVANYHHGVFRHYGIPDRLFGGTHEIVFVHVPAEGGVWVQPIFDAASYSGLWCKGCDTTP
ncbi:hypothetical protein ACU6TU_13495 [Halomonas sp. LS-001]